MKNLKKFVVSGIASILIITLLPLALDFESIFAEGSFLGVQESFVDKVSPFGDQVKVFHLDASTPGKGQKASVNDFLRYDGTTTTITLPAGTTSIQWQVHFGATVDLSTFSATLNKATFNGYAPLPGGTTEKTATIPLQDGRNVLKLSIEGPVDGRTATDTDRIVFKVG